MEIKKLQLGSFGVNCYIIKIADKCFLIDPGSEPDTIERYLESNSIKPDFILNTHGHYDHIGAVPEIMAKYNIPFYIDRDEIDIITDPDRNMSSFFTGNGLSLKTYINIDDNLKERLKGLGLFIYKVPGHTPGSIMIVIESKAMFTGDLLFKGSIGRTDLPGGDMKEIKRSLQSLKSFDKDIEVFPGHGPDTTLKEEIDNNFYLQKDFLNS